jgi:hypothetical protein
MNTEFFTHDHPHRMSYYATHPIALFLSALAALQIRAIASQCLIVCALLGRSKIAHLDAFKCRF